MALFTYYDSVENDNKMAQFVHNPNAYVPLTVEEGDPKLKSNKTICTFIVNIVFLILLK